MSARSQSEWEPCTPAPTPGECGIPNVPTSPRGKRSLGASSRSSRQEGPELEPEPRPFGPDPFIPGGQSTGCPACRTEVLLMPQPGPRVWQRATPGGRGLCLAKPGRHQRPGCTCTSTSTGGPTARPALSQPRQRAERRRGLAVTPSPGQAFLSPSAHPRAALQWPRRPWTLDLSSLVCLDRKPASLLQVPEVRARRTSPGGLTPLSL